jgi:hypothetical protein
MSSIFASYSQGAACGPATRRAPAILAGDKSRTQYPGAVLVELGAKQTLKQALHMRNLLIERRCLQDLLLGIGIER